MNPRKACAAFDDTDWLKYITKGDDHSVIGSKYQATGALGILPGPRAMILV